MQKDDKKEKPELTDMQKRYRNVFSTLEGQEVLKDRLLKLKWYETIKTDEDRVRHNVALELLDMCGGFQTKILGIHK